MTKDHILQEIRRTARINDGVPFGQERFVKETGIRYSDWRGKYWARWSDALSEAGFDPNVYNKAIDREIILEKYIAYIRELGRLPVDSELLLKKRKDPSFPANTTFYGSRGKFNSKKDLVIELQEYCQKRKGYEDIVWFCKQYVETSNNEKDIMPLRSPAGEGGFVYLIKAGRF